MKYSLLDGINSPSDVKKLNKIQCLTLCDEIRTEIDKIIDTM